MSLSISKVFVPALVLSTFVACHARAADPPHMVSPSIDVEVDDRGPDRTSHVAKLSVVLVDGNAKMHARDGDLLYEVAAHFEGAEGSRLALHLSRDHGTSRDLMVTSSIAAKASGRVIVAKIDRADGHTTTITAQVH